MKSASLLTVVVLLAGSVCAACGDEDCTRTATCESSDGGAGATGGTSSGGMASSGGGTVGGGGSGATGAGGQASSHVATAVTAGLSHTCALLSDATVACWGANEDGQLGDGTFEPSLAPVLVEGLSDVSEIAAGERHTCAVKSNGSVWCWGDSTYRQVDQTSDAGVPVQIGGLTNVGGIGAGANHTCSHANGGAAKCWGADLSAQLGSGITTSSSSPLDVADLSVVSDLAGATDYSCAIADTATVFCWGLAPDVVDSYTPTAIGWIPSPGPPLTGTDLAVADGRACVLRADKPWCWGTNGQTAATEVDLPNVVELAGGGGHLCARIQNGDLMCWGANEAGQIGDGTTGGTEDTPTAVMGVDDASAIGLGTSHTCAVVGAGAVMCWGANDAGQLGDGTTDPSPTPVVVTSFP